MVKSLEYEYENRKEDLKSKNNIEVFKLEILWKNKEPRVLWEQFPEEIILNIFKFVNSNFVVRFGKYTYTPISQIEYNITKYENIHNGYVNNMSLEELISLRSGDLQINTDNLVESTVIERRSDPEFYTILENYKKNRENPVEYPKTKIDIIHEYDSDSDSEYEIL